MLYIAALDRNHLDNGLFLSSLARAVSQQYNVQPVIIHADSAYTDRIMQKGVTREEAEIRSQKELNRRLVALFADQGVSAIGIHGYQRKFISVEGTHFKLDETFFRRLPPESALIISCLVWSDNSDKPVTTSIAGLSHFLQNRLNTGPVFVFSASDNSNLFDKKEPSTLHRKDLTSEFIEKHMPAEFRSTQEALYLITPEKFSRFPKSNDAVLID